MCGGGGARRCKPVQLIVGQLQARTARTRHTMFTAIAQTMLNLSLILILTVPRITVTRLTVARDGRGQRGANVAIALVVARTHVPVGIHHHGGRRHWRSTRLHAAPHRIRVISIVIVAIIILTAIIAVIAVITTIMLVAMVVIVVVRAAAAQTRQLDAARDRDGVAIVLRPDTVRCEKYRRKHSPRIKKHGIKISVTGIERNFHCFVIKKITILMELLLSLTDTCLILIAKARRDQVSARRRPIRLLLTEADDQMQAIHGMSDIGLATCS